MAHPVVQQLVFRAARPDSGVAGRRQDRRLLLLVDRAVGPGDFDERDEGEGGHGLRPDVQLDELAQDALVVDPGDIAEGLDRRLHLLHLPEFLDELPVFLKEEELFQAQLTAESAAVIHGHHTPSGLRAGTS
ncbi:MAG TPA: hypothetical protein DD417_07985 [Elusimicrobia bacterium]|nr:hypothetical protein [Elusimicrobiota bacterium]